MTIIDNDEVPLDAFKQAIGRLRTLRDHLLETGRSDLNQTLLTIRSCASDLHLPTLIPSWLHHELNGYPDDADLPAYRRIAISCYATVSHPGWTTGDVHLYNVEIDFRDPVSILPFERSAGLEIPRPDLRETHRAAFSPGVSVLNVKGLITPAVCTKMAASIQSRALNLVEDILGRCNEFLHFTAENETRAPSDRASPRTADAAAGRGEYRKLVVTETIKGLWRHLPDFIKSIRPDM